MKKSLEYFCFKLHEGSDIEIIWDNLENSGLQLLYSSVDDQGHAEIFGLLPANFSFEKLQNLCPAISEIIPLPPLEIDWSSQWALHGQDYHEGYVHIDLKELFSKDLPLIRLQPGPGFGDLSHPTTRLVLQMMPEFVKDKVVLDIGSGSGILSLCAAAMGASKVYGLDIDEEANLHAQQNAELNNLQQQTAFMLPINFNQPAACMVALLNMIRSEQIVAWESLSHIHSQVEIVMASGILESERETYLAQCRTWGWKLEEETNKEGWLGFRFTNLK
jgi:ribosomal protein L11 methyltransferase